MYAKFTSVFAVVLAACAGVQGAAAPATRPDISRPSIPTGRCIPTVVLATVTSTRYLTQYTTATADDGVTKKRRGDDHPHALAARQVAPVTTTVTSTSTIIAMSTSTVTTTLTRSTTARATTSSTVTSTVTGRPVVRTETATNTITSMATSTAPTPTSTITTTVTTTVPP